MARAGWQEGIGRRFSTGAFNISVFANKFPSPSRSFGPRPPRSGRAIAYEHCTPRPIGPPPHRGGGDRRARRPPSMGRCRAPGLAFDKPEDRLREAGGVMPATPGRTVRGLRACFIVATPAEASGLFKERSQPRWEKSGSGAHGRAFLVLIRGAASAPRRCSCPGGGRGRCPWSPSGPGLGGSSPSSVPLRHQPGTVPATFARFASRVPVQEMRKYRPG